MFEQSFPNRCPNHIRETSSFKIFSNHIPNQWLIREVSERDYGIDALVELVTTTGQVTGEFISIQLKSKSEVSFDLDGKFRNYNINKTNTNYWLNSNLITFIFLVDDSSGIMYIKSVNDYVIKNYDRYLKSEKFYYDFYLADNFSISRFLDVYSWTKCIRALDQELFYFENIHSKLCHLYKTRIRRNFHMLVDDDNVLRDFFYVYDSMFKLCQYLAIDWGILPPRQFVDANPIGIDADYNDYYIYEHHMTQLLLMLDKKMVQMLSIVKTVVCNDYYSYWVKKQESLVIFLSSTSLVSLDEHYWSSKT